MTISEYIDRLMKAATVAQANHDRALADIDFAIAHAKKTEQRLRNAIEELEKIRD